jgi:hypothetical protein
MFLKHYDNDALIRWALTYAMKENTGISVAWDCVTLHANGSHVAFSEINTSCHQDDATAIMKSTTEIWRELHPRTVD